LATYQALAGTWYRAMKSFTWGLRIPGHPSKQENRMSIKSGIFVAKSSM
jgi:hypothetical protein